MTVVLDFLREVLLGTAIGVGIGLGISYLTSKFDDQHIEVALTVIAAYGANVAAMELHASGVIAVVVCGMMIGNVGVKHGMSPTTREEVVSFWEFAAFLANSFVFILIGLEIKLAGLWDQVVPIVLFFVIMILVRAVRCLACTALCGARICGSSRNGSPSSRGPECAAACRWFWR